MAGARFTLDDDLDKLPPHIRAQIAPVLAAADGGPVEQAEGRAKAARGQMNRPEQEEGRDLVNWVETMYIPAPWDPDETIWLAEYFAHVPNGGARTAVEGAILKGQGVRKGYPDYVVDLAIGRYHGMRLELKAIEGSKPDADQLDLLQRLERAGYKVAVCWGFEDARRAIEQYLANAG